MVLLHFVMDIQHGVLPGPTTLFAFFSHHTHIRVGGQPEGGTVKAVTNSF